MSIVKNYIDLKKFKTIKFYSQGGTVNIKDDKKRFKKYPLTYGIYKIDNNGKIKGDIPASLNELTITNGMFSGTFTRKKNTKTTNIFSEWTNLKSIFKIPVMTIKNKKEMRIQLTDDDFIVYLKNCSNIIILAEVPNKLRVITENCNGSIKIYSTIKKKKEKKCPEKECPEKECPEKECPKIICPVKICPKPTYIYYQGALGGVGLILFSLILYNILVKCEKIEED